MFATPRRSKWTEKIFQQPAKFTYLVGTLRHGGAAGKNLKNHLNKARDRRTWQFIHRVQRSLSRSNNMSPAFSSTMLSIVKCAGCELISASSNSATSVTGLKTATNALAPREAISLPGYVSTSNLYHKQKHRNCIKLSRISTYTY